MPAFRARLPDERCYRRPAQTAARRPGMVPRGGTLASLLEKKEQRLRFMHRLYEVTDGSPLWMWRAPALARSSDGPSKRQTG
jgi:hypothetical protein